MATASKTGKNAAKAEPKEPKRDPKTFKEGEYVHVNILTEVYIDAELNNRELADSEEEIEQLALAIESTDGLLQPIGIYPTPDSRLTEHNMPYELGYGYRRCAALKFLATQNDPDDPVNSRWVTQVPAKIKAKASIAQRHLDQLIENLMRKDLNPMEVALTFKKILDDPQSDLSQADLARRIGWKPATLSNYLKAANELDGTVQDLIMSSELTWSKGRLIASLGLPAEQQRELATIGTGMTQQEFEDHVSSTYKKEDAAEDTKADGEQTGTTTEGAGTKSTQKIHTAVRADVLRTKYLPHLEETAKTTKDKNEKAKIAIQMDTMKFILNEQGTELGASLAPWEAELEKKKEEEKAANEEKSRRGKYVRQAVLLINKKLKETPPVTLPDGSPNPNRALPTLPQALQQIRASVEADLKKGADEGHPENTLIQGFKIDGVDQFMQEISEAYAANQKKAADNAAKKAAEKQEAENKEAAEKAGQEQAAQPAGATA